MVALSKRISESVRNKKGAISEDETVQFKSYLLSLGVDDPVTKEGSKSMYFYDLAREISKVMLKPIEEAGGVIPLSEAYCRLNRARGLEVEENECLSADGLSRLLGIPLVLATERLLCAEEAGLLCRDDSIEVLLDLQKQPHPINKMLCRRGKTLSFRLKGVAFRTEIKEF
uniref:Vacuolar protein-sorting-associated protein 36 n=1 Tax=Romanomermis culicivorax TaxID=13658 RepID=A0A915IFV8_ROMCU